jgi:hypothetical protein
MINDPLLSFQDIACLVTTISGKRERGALFIQTVPKPAESAVFGARV